MTSLVTSASAMLSIGSSSCGVCASSNLVVWASIVTLKVWLCCDQILSKIRILLGLQHAAGHILDTHQFSVLATNLEACSQDVSVDLRRHQHSNP